VTPLILFGVMAFAPPGSTGAVEPLPSIDWLAAGPSYNGSHWGASFAGDMPVSGKISLYGVVDYSFAAHTPTQTFSPGFNFDVLGWTWGRWEFRLDLLTLAGVTTTPSAVLGNFTGGAHFGACRGRFCVGLAARQLTNPPAPREPRIYNVGLEYRFK
jgi:hypothetical protein